MNEITYSDLEAGHSYRTLCKYFDLCTKETTLGRVMKQNEIFTILSSHLDLFNDVVFLKLLTKYGIEYCYMWLDSHKVQNVYRFELLK